MNLIEIRNKINNGYSLYDLNLRVTFYARVSTEDLKQINSLNNQACYFKDMIINNSNWIYVDGYIDEGISGTSVKHREEFMRMIDDAKDNKFDLIVTKEISRFSRNTLDSIKYTRELLNYGVIVLFLNDNINTALSDSELRLTIMASMAQDEIRRLSERVKFGMKRSIEKGIILGNNLIYGYDKCQNKLIINQEEALIVNRIFNDYVKDSSVVRIANSLNKLNVKTKLGGKWSATSVSRIIRNPKYKGYYCGNKSEVVDYMSKKIFYHDYKDWIIYKDFKIPVIISEELWDKANLIYQKKHKARNTHITLSQKVLDDSRYTFKLICCDHNEIFVRCAGSNRRSNPTWVCKKYKNEGVLTCESPIIREKKLDELMDNIINNRMKEYVRDVSNEMIKLYNEILIISNNKLKIDLENKLKELISHKDKLINLNLSKIISDDDLKNKLKKNELEISKINNELKNIKEDIDISSNINDIEKEIKNILNVKYNLNVFINLLLDKIIVTKLDNRYKMNLKIYFKDGNIKEVLFEN